MPQKQRSYPASFLSRYPALTATLIFLLVACVTYALWSNARSEALDRLQDNFEFRSQDAIEDIAERLHTYRLFLQGANGFIAGSVTIDREKFREYVEALDIEEHYPGLQGIGISAVVPHEPDKGYVQSVRGKEFSRYSGSSVGDRDFYTAVTHVEPLTVMNQYVLGFDMFRDAARRSAMTEALNSGKVTLSGKVNLIQGPGSAIQPGLLMYSPIYKGVGATKAVEDRRERIVGWVYASFRMNDFMQGLVEGENTGLQMTIYDGRSNAQEDCLFGCTNRDENIHRDENNPLFIKTVTTSAIGRPWTIEVRSTSSFDNLLNTQPAHFILLVGSIVSTLLAILVWLLASRKRHAIELAKTMTEDLRVSEFRWRFALEGAGDGVWEWNIETGWVHYSEKWKGMLGYADSEIAPHISEWKKIIHQEDHASMLALLENIQSGKTDKFSGEYRLRCKNGEWKWILCRGMLVERNEHGKPLRMIGTHTDISEQKEAEQLKKEQQASLEEARTALQQAQKLEAIGRMTGEVAHDFNNILQVIVTNIQLLLLGNHDETQLKQRLNNILNAAQKGAKLPAQLLAFARRQPLNPAVVNLRTLIEDNDDILFSALEDSIEVKTIVPNNLWNTVVDINRLETVLMNLVINASHAMENGGSLTIELSNAVLSRHSAHIHPDVKEGEYVLLSVSDTGSGMSDDVIKRAFEPFFTTKKEGKGSGLGLSMAYGFVKQSGGYIYIDSQLGKGTTINIYLPRSTEPVSTASVTPEGLSAGGDELILVVEDNLEVQETAVTMLTQFGYRVLKADDGDRALEVLENNKNIDVLFTDVIMPGSVRGLELAKRAREMIPGIAVLFASGYTNNEIEIDGRMPSGMDLLHKPYRSEELAKKIRQAIANGKQAAAA